MPVTPIPAIRGNAITLAVVLLVACITSASAQQPACPPGSACATTTVDGRYLPPPPPPFKGDIELNALQSKAYWPPRVVPPKGAPNVLLIMTDDVGFAAPSTFGGVIPTPCSRQSRRHGAPLHQLPFDITLFADACCSHYGP
jgi:arylsulfatase